MKDIFFTFPDYIDALLVDLFVIMCVLTAAYVVVLLVWGLLKLGIRMVADLKGDLLRLRV